MKLKFNILELIGFIGYWFLIITYIYILFNINKIIEDEIHADGAKISIITSSTVIIFSFTLLYQIITRHFDIIIKLFSKKFEIKLPS
jgi:hypothetical protein